MGTTSIVLLDELHDLAQEHKPNIIVLTETKLTGLPQERKLLEPYLPEYKLYHSRVKGRMTDNIRSGNGGITIAVHKTLTTQDSVHPIHLQPKATVRL